MRTPRLVFSLLAAAGFSAASVPGQTTFVLADFSHAAGQFAFFEAFDGPDSLEQQAGYLTIHSTRPGGALADYLYPGQDYQAFTALAISGRRDAGNDVDTFHVFFESSRDDSSTIGYGEVDVAVRWFGSAFSTVVVPFHLPGLDLGSIVKWGIRARVPSEPTTGHFNFSFDEISLVDSSLDQVSLIPEPSTYALLAGAAVLALALRRRRLERRSS